MKEGDTIIHKASQLRMVVLRVGRDWQHPLNVRCRRYNETTGSYETADFEKIEFEEQKENK